MSPRLEALALLVFFYLCAFCVHMHAFGHALVPSNVMYVLVCACVLLRLYSWVPVCK
jgi:hypothetical protein